MHEGHPAVSRGIAALAVTLVLLVATSIAARASSASAHLEWLDPDGREVHFSSPEELRMFFETASVVDREGIRVGITGSRRLLLENGDVRLHAHFQAVDESRDFARTASGEIELDSRDSYKFNVAAYRLGLLLGIHSIPPSFPRTIDQLPGSITAWVENAFSERDRVERDERPPSPQRWVHHITRMHVFDQLIANVDRNQGNILIDQDWNVWLIDHTRAFRVKNRLADPESINSCDRRFWTGLKTLSDERIREAVEPWLTKKETKALLSRRKQLVTRIEQLLSTQSEARVLHTTE